MSARQRTLSAGPPTPDEATFVWRVLEAFSFDANGELFWRVDDGHMSLFADCSDVFAWGGSDLEQITPDNLPQLLAARQDANAAAGGRETHEWVMLFCARERSMRPQGAMYRHIRPELHALFDACGPVRAVGLGNPVGRDPEPPNEQPQEALVD